jgi:hypothetical protein
MGEVSLPAMQARGKCDRKCLRSNDSWLAAPLLPGVQLGQRTRQTLLLASCMSLALSACKSDADRACLKEFASAQAVVLAVDAKELASVDASIAALDQALASCKAADRGFEVQELAAAHEQLSRHQERLLARAERERGRTELTAAELESLVKGGDPKCPRGQAYLHAKTKQRIRCAGPQPIDMGYAEADAYFKGRGYKREAGARPGELRFEYGAELLVFDFDEANSTGPARCVVLYPPPDRSWQEATARVSGVAPARLAPDRDIPGKLGARRLQVEDSAQKVRVRIGECSE